MSNCTIIANFISWNLLTENIENYLPIEMKIHLSSVESNLKTSIENKM